MRGEMSFLADLYGKVMREANIDVSPLLFYYNLSKVIKKLKDNNSIF